MLTIQNVHKAFGSQIIFNGADLQMNSGDRFALMGPNGAGKSTLFRMLLGEVEPDEGEIVVRRDLRFGHLPQETASFHGRSVLEEALGSPEEHPDGHVDERAAAGAKKILMGLGFRTADFARPVEELSGGWRMRVAIARLLVEDPDVLLLDEPTNHLDLESLLWFQSYLQRWRGSLLVISHDRAFVNAVVGSIVELRDQQLRRYPGDYEHFLEMRRQEEEKLVAAYNRQQKEIEEYETFIARFRAQASKAPQVQSRIKMLEKMERIELPAELKKVKIRFPQPGRTGVRTLVLKDIHKSYGEVKVYQGLDFELERGQKMAFVGHNGAGKSTLLKLLAGVVPFESGERLPGLNVEVGYYAQHRVEMLNSDRTVLEEAQDTRRMNPDLFVRTVLGTFLFRGDSVYKKVRVLSGGEKSRLALVKLLLDPPNVLLLDEPTTHLDMASVEALTDALKEFEGTLCFISHDLFFVNSLADHVVHVERGKVTVYPGNYEYFQRRQAQKESEAEQEAAPPPARPSLEDVPAVSAVAPAAAEPGPSPEDRRAGKKARRKIKARIADLEDELSGLNGELASHFVKSDYKKLMALDEAIKRAEQELADRRKDLEGL
ncbi:MAG: ABC-F family ATP-binding cassette domain-containing protein [Elusimicrobiota bacterium]